MTARLMLLFVVVAFTAPLVSATTTNPPTTTTLIARESLWRYWDNADPPGPSWKTAAFPDGGWPLKPAQFGYGEADEATQVSPGNIPRITTHYFRRKFHVPRASDCTNLLAEVLRDDGVVVHINGQEVFRMNLPSGEINHFTYASAQVTGTNENFYFPTNFSSSVLVNGENIIAIELHQTENPTDASFDMSLAAIGPARIEEQPPSLSVERSATAVTLRWQGSDALLEQLRLPGGSWEPLTNAVSPHELPASLDSHLFRLRRK
jgi:hypothetical protein